MTGRGRLLRDGTEWEITLQPERAIHMLQCHTINPLLCGLGGREGGEVQPQLNNMTLIILQT